MGEVLICETWLADDDSFESGKAWVTEGQKIDESFFDSEIDEVCQLTEIILPKIRYLESNGYYIADSSNSFLKLMPVNGGVRVHYKKDSLQSSFHIYEGAGYLHVEKNIHGLFPLSELRANNHFVLINSETDTAKVWTIVENIDGKIFLKFQVDEGEIFIQNIEGFPIVSGKKGSVFYLDESGNLTVREGIVECLNNCPDEEDISNTEVLENEEIKIQDSYTNSSVSCSANLGVSRPIFFSKELIPLSSTFLLIVVVIGFKNKILRILFRKKIKNIV